MSSETRTLRPYEGVGFFQEVLDGCHLVVGDRVVEGGARVSLTLDEYLNYPMQLRLAADDQEAHEHGGAVADGLAGLGLSPSDVELVVLTVAPRLKMVDVLFESSLDLLGDIPRVVSFPAERPRALRGPNGGCDIRVFFSLARELVPRALYPWRKGTWLGRQEFQLRSDLSGSGFKPVRLTDVLRREIGLDTNATRYVRLDDAVSAFTTDVPPDAVLVYIDEGLLDQLAVFAYKPLGKQLQRQLFLDAAWAITQRAIADIVADNTLATADIDESRGSLVHGLIELTAGRGLDRTSVEARNTRFRELVNEPARFMSNLEARLATRRDVLEVFEG